MLLQRKSGMLVLKNGRSRTDCKARCRDEATEQEEDRKRRVQTGWERRLKLNLPIPYEHGSGLCAWRCLERC